MYHHVHLVMGRHVPLESSEAAVSGPLNLDLNRLRALSSELADIASEAESALQQLQTALSGQLAPWGNDDLGKQFAKTYVPDENNGLADFRATVQSIGDVGGQLNVAAADFSAADHDSSRMISNAAAELNPPFPTAAVASSWPSRAGPGSGSPIGAAASDGALSPSAGPGGSSSGVPRANNDVGANGSSANTGSPEDGQTASGTPQSGSASSEPLDSPSGAPRIATPAEETPQQSGAVATKSSPVAGSASAAGSGITAPTASTTPWERAAAQPDTPQSGSVRPPTSGRGAPPRIGNTARPADARKSGRSQPQPKSDPAAEPLGVRVARALASKYGLDVSGFDAPGIGDTVFQQFAAAVDEVLTASPAIALSGVAIGELLDGEPTRIVWAADFERTEQAAILTLNVTAARDLPWLTETVRAVRSSQSILRSTEQPVYSTIKRELERILDTDRNTGHSGVVASLPSDQA